MCRQDIFVDIFMFRNDSPMECRCHRPDVLVLAGKRIGNEEGRQKAEKATERCVIRF